jgi:hypothetical protein
VHVGTDPHALTETEKMVGLLPDGAQIVVELDLARLRANPVVGPVVSRALASIAVSTDVDLPMQVPSQPLAKTEALVFAAYAVGTDQAGTVTLLATHEDVVGGRHVSDDVVAFGSDSWLALVDARAAIAAKSPLGPSHDMEELRDHAQPQGATGAAVRVTARLSFDARIQLAKQTGVELAPAQVSVWADVADDLALVVDADAGGESQRKMGGVVRGLLGELADTPALRALGLPGALDGAVQSRDGTWVRTIVTVGPAHLKRVVARANALLGPDEGSAVGSAS